MEMSIVFDFSPLRGSMINRVEAATPKPRRAA
jgi:hypothetical protein